MSFSKQEPKIFYYRDYKTFNDEHFRNDLKYVFNKRGLNNISCSEFEDITITTLNIHAPMKKKYLRANNAPYTNRALCNAIKVRSKLLNIFRKLNTIESHDAQQTIQETKKFLCFSFKDDKKELLRKLKC